MNTIPNVNRLSATERSRVYKAVEAAYTPELRLHDLPEVLAKAQDYMRLHNAIRWLQANPKDTTEVVELIRRDHDMLEAVKHVIRNRWYNYAGKCLQHLQAERATPELIDKLPDLWLTREQKMEIVEAVKNGDEPDIEYDNDGLPWIDDNPELQAKVVQTIADQGGQLTLHDAIREVRDSMIEEYADRVKEVLSK